MLDHANMPTAQSTNTPTTTQLGILEIHKQQHGKKWLQ
jgi:hypothetical protein